MRLMKTHVCTRILIDKRSVDFLHALVECGREFLAYDCGDQLFVYAPYVDANDDINYACFFERHKTPRLLRVMYVREERLTYVDGFMFWLAKSHADAWLLARAVPPDPAFKRRYVDT